MGTATSADAHAHGRYPVITAQRTLMTVGRKRAARIALDFTTVALIVAGFVIASGGRLPKVHHEAPVHEQPGVVIVGTTPPSDGLHI